ncbi:hypothetical protein BG261_07855 [Floricoccus tropicus]|uniref:Uncharacterized protein n=1 Tax=Floricoccus tropicus TaxID=1859473 RepID=A0A1E8GJ22_9LACT|nr:hypothetical protein [Floricoccus tropicus]OFI48187.1 hypothetical protein BG261_07855 [Floricoccus tropicus]
MKYLESYFDDDSSQSILDKEYREYKKYLINNKDNFDENTIEILAKMDYHDAKIVNVTLSEVSKAKNDWEKYIDLKINLLSYDKSTKYEVLFEDVKDFSFTKSFNNLMNNGFGDVLVMECIHDEENYIFELYLSECIPMLVKSREFKITKSKI